MRDSENGSRRKTARRHGFRSRLFNVLMFTSEQKVTNLFTPPNEDLHSTPQHHSITKSPNNHASTRPRPTRSAHCLPLSTHSSSPKHPSPPPATHTLRALRLTRPPTFRNGWPSSLLSWPRSFRSRRANRRNHRTVRDSARRV